MKNRLEFKIIRCICLWMLLLISFSEASAHSNAKKNAVPRLSNQTIIIYLTGFSGTGKYTIAKKISKLGYKLVDNHLINNPIFSLLEDDDTSNDDAFEKINQIRSVVFDFMREDRKSNYILTNELLENDYHYNIYKQVLQVANHRHSLFIPIKLVISREERAKRIVQKERAVRFKTTNVEEVYQKNKLIKISHPNQIELNVTHLSADEAASKIMQYVKNIRNREASPD